jgi:hypothetical protein
MIFDPAPNAAQRIGYPSSLTAMTVGTPLPIKRSVGRAPVLT